MANCRDEIWEDQEAFILSIHGTQVRLVSAFVSDCCVCLRPFSFRSSLPVFLLSRLPSAACQWPKPVCDGMCRASARRVLHQRHSPELCSMALSVSGNAFSYIVTANRSTVTWRLYPLSYAPPSRMLCAVHVGICGLVPNAFCAR